MGKEKVEQIRTMARTINNPSPLAAEPSNQSTPGRSQITVTLAPVSQTKINFPQPTQIFPKNRGEYFPPEKQIKNDNTNKSVQSQPVNVNVVSSKTTRAPPPPRQSNKNQTHAMPTQSETTDSKTSEPKKSGSRIRAGCINARAKFWEKMIQGDDPVSEEEFPSMVEQVPD